MEKEEVLKKDCIHYTGKICKIQRSSTLSCNNCPFYMGNQEERIDNTMETIVVNETNNDYLWDLFRALENIGYDQLLSPKKKYLTIHIHFRKKGKQKSWMNVIIPTRKKRFIIEENSPAIDAIFYKLMCKAIRIRIQIKPTTLFDFATYDHKRLFSAYFDNETIVENKNKITSINEYIFPEGLDLNALVTHVPFFNIDNRRCIEEDWFYDYFDIDDIERMVPVLFDFPFELNKFAYDWFKQEIEVEFVNKITCGIVKLIATPEVDIESKLYRKIMSLLGKKRCTIDKMVKAILNAAKTNRKEFKEKTGIDVLHLAVIFAYNKKLLDEIPIGTIKRIHNLFGYDC